MGFLILLTTDKFPSIKEFDHHWLILRIFVHEYNTNMDCSEYPDRGQRTNSEAKQRSCIINDKHVINNGSMSIPATIDLNKMHSNAISSMQQNHGYKYGSDNMAAATWQRQHGHNSVVNDKIAATERR